MFGLRNLLHVKKIFFQKLLFPIFQEARLISYSPRWPWSPSLCLCMSRVVRVPARHSKAWIVGTGQNAGPGTDSPSHHYTHNARSLYCRERIQNSTWIKTDTNSKNKIWTQKSLFDFYSRFSILIRMFSLKDVKMINMTISNWPHWWHLQVTRLLSLCGNHQNLHPSDFSGQDCNDSPWSDRPVEIWT